MFNPPWAESQNLSSDSPREIPLPEDDGHAMRQICCVTHHRNDAVSDRPSPGRILQIAILADKYDITRALKYSSAQWLSYNYRSCGEETDMTDVGRLLTSACLFHNAEMVAVLSLRLMLDFKGTDTYLDLSSDCSISQFLPWKTFCEHHCEFSFPLMLALVFPVLTMYQVSWKKGGLGFDPPYVRNWLIALLSRPINENGDASVARNIRKPAPDTGR